MEINLPSVEAAVFKDLEESGGTDCRGVCLLMGRLFSLSFCQRCCCKADHRELLEASHLELLGASCLALLEIDAACIEGLWES